MHVCIYLLVILCEFFFFKQKTAYEMRISDWSSDVCSSDLADGHAVPIVTVANSSATHGYLSRGRLTIVQRDASGRELIRQTLTGPDIQQGAGYGLIGGNEMRRLTLPLELPAEVGAIQTRFEPELPRLGRGHASPPAPFQPTEPRGG